MLAAICEISNMAEKINLGRAISDRANLLFKKVRMLNRVGILVVLMCPP